MSFKDNSGMLYVDPNAYIQNCKPSCERKKVVFSEPYENMANFYINNNFKRGDCSCGNDKHKECFNSQNNAPCDFDKKEEHCKQKKDDSNKSNSFSLPFDIKNLLPLLGGIGGGGGGLSNIVSMLGNSGLGGNSGGMGEMLKGLSSGGGLADLVKMFTQNSGGLGGLLNLFKKTTGDKKINSPKSSDICIKDYQRVE